MSETSKLAPGFPQENSTRVSGAPTQPPATSATTSGTQPTLPVTAPTTRVPSPVVTVPVVPTMSSSSAVPFVVQWAQERNLSRPFIDTTSTSVVTHLAAMDNVLSANALATVNDVTGLLANEDLTKELPGLFASESLSTKNTVGKVLSELRLSLSEKTSPQKARGPAVPEPSSTEIRDLFSKDQILMPAIELMGPARLYGKLLRDNAAAAGSKAFSDITLRKEAAPLSRQRNTPGNDDDVLEQLRKALQDSDTTVKRQQQAGHFTSLSEWTQHYLVWAFAASATTQINKVAALNHLNNVCQITSQQDLSLALSYDHKIRKLLSAEIACDPTICPNTALTNKNETVISELLNRAARFESDRPTPDVGERGKGKSRKGHADKEKGKGKGKGAKSSKTKHPREDQAAP